MATRTEHYQEWDAQGNLIRDEMIEVTEVETDPAMTNFVATLTTEQQQALRQALGQ